MNTSSIDILQEHLQALQSEGLQAFERAHSLQNLQDIKSLYLGPKGALSLQMKSLKDLPPDERGSVGKAVNAVKEVFEGALNQKREALQKAARLSHLGPAIDPSLPSSFPSQAPLHPLTQTRQLLLSIFKKLGFTAVEGPDVDTEWFCLDAHNIPENHPARAEKDTFFLKDIRIPLTPKHADEAYILRTQTSTVQIRTMLKHQPPLKVVSAGRVFRRDNVDATHNFNFYQLEGLQVDRETSLVDLKATLDYAVREIFGKNYKTRLRPSFFPFTEPGFEMDVFVEKLGKFRNEWIELLGCGMVHPNVFRAVGLEEGWQGFAFAFGLDRLTMFLHGIEDIRRLYQNDERFLRQF